MPFAHHHHSDRYTTGGSWCFDIIDNPMNNKNKNQKNLTTFTLSDL